MTILVTGATGNIGGQIIQHLVDRGADVRALVRDSSKANFPEGVAVTKGDFLDVDSLRTAFDGVSTLFLLNAVTPDEFTQALIALNVARSAGIERMIEQMGFHATILRPAYFIQNDLTIKDVITGYGFYPMPVGTKGLAMIDVRDIAEIAALELLRREQSAQPLPIDRINLVGPDTLTGANIAAIWTDVLARQINYGGGDTAAFEQNLKQFMPAWMAYDLRMMAERFLTDGMLPEGGDVERLTTLLGRPLRSYRDFASETAASA